MGASNFRDGYEFEPGNYATGGGLSGLPLRAIHQRTYPPSEGESGEPQNRWPN